MSYYWLDAGKTGLLFFDMLNAYFRKRGEPIAEAARPMVANCTRLADAAREVGIPVFYARADHRPDGLDSARLHTDTDISLRPWQDPDKEYARPFEKVPGGSWEAQVIDELRPQPDDYTILKHRWSAFHQTHLELSLRTRGIDTIILCGGSTEVGVASTAYSARDRDFQLIIVRDACATSHPDNHDALMYRVFPRMARVRTADQVIEMIRQGLGPLSSQ
ncbi:MAG: cysteine hydrolase [Chloroflexi bacterium]|nr:cysteine hydrolase [Chloroflexota bacterium]